MSFTNSPCPSPYANSFPAPNSLNTMPDETSGSMMIQEIELPERDTVVTYDLSPLTEVSRRAVLKLFLIFREW